MTQIEDGNIMVNEVNMNHKYLDIVIKALSKKNLAKERENYDKFDDDSRSQEDEEREMEIYLYDLLTCEEEFEENEDNSKIHKLLCEFLDLKDFQPLDFLVFTSKWYYMNEKIRKNLINKNGVIWLNSYS